PCSLLLSLHDALPIFVMTQCRGTLMGKVGVGVGGRRDGIIEGIALTGDGVGAIAGDVRHEPGLAEARLLVLGGGRAVTLEREVGDRKSTRLNSSHVEI